MNEQENLSGGCGGECSGCSGASHGQCSGCGSPEMVAVELNGKIVNCMVLVIFDIDDISYIILLPHDENNRPQNEVLFYRYIENEGSNPTLGVITSEEEFNQVGQVFEAWVDEMKSASKKQ